jgi:hypothetical protein
VPEAFEPDAEPRGLDGEWRRCLTAKLRAPNLLDFPCAVQRFTCWPPRWVADR